MGELFVGRTEIGSREINLPPLAHMMYEMGMGGQEWAGQFANGFPVIGIIPEPGVYPEVP